MAAKIEIKVPDIGGATNVEIIELPVKVGDEVTKEMSLLTLESDKASMEIPSPAAGKITKLLVQVGDKVSQGTVIMIVDSAELNAKNNSLAKDKALEKQNEKKEEKKPESAQPSSSTSHLTEVKIPDIGGAQEVEVIAILVNKGDLVEKEQALITLEGDKATMDIPSPFSGTVETISLQVGNKVSQGSLILTMHVTANKQEETNETGKQVDKEIEHAAEKNKPAVDEQPIQQPIAEPSPIQTESKLVSAGPATRRMAREFGVNLERVPGSGRKNRITKEDVQNYIKQKLNENSQNGGFALPEIPLIDFSQFGVIESKPLNRIKRLTGTNVHRSWITIPHVTQFDEADITSLEAFRKQESEAAQQKGYKLTLLAFVTKVVSQALRQFPQFNASLDPSGENLIFKQYYNVGIAVETPNGLVVPVIKNVQQRSVADIAQEMAILSKKARDKSLTSEDMKGGCFTISSLGGIGGTAFTPIVNSPEVSILGLSRSQIKPVFDQGEFKPRLLLPLSLSYDHRVIDGAEAARFTRYIVELLEDIRRILL